VKKLLLNLILLVADLGLNRLFRSMNRDKIRVLMYHGITSQGPPTFYWTQLHRREFEWQMQYLARHYDVVDPEVLASRDTSGINRVVITFDDGFADLATEARPILERWRFPSVIFVVTSLVEARGTVWTDLVYSYVVQTERDSLDLSPWGIPRIDIPVSISERAHLAIELKERLKAMPGNERDFIVANITERQKEEGLASIGCLRLLSVSQIKSLSEGGAFQIASHTHTHPILATLPPARQDEEIQVSLECLKEWGLPPSPLFAYPNGRPVDFNADTVAALQRQGIKASVTTVDGLFNLSTDPFRIPRIPVGADMSRLEFKARLSGFFHFIRRLGRGSASQVDGM
jgi:peptidoglycan/xylan/chitin deacetylase (PgdA/CDA1 family)